MLTLYKKQDGQTLVIAGHFNKHELRFYLEADRLILDQAKQLRERRKYESKRTDKQN